MREIGLEPFDEADIEELTRIMERAFDADALMHLGKKADRLDTIRVNSSAGMASINALRSLKLRLAAIRSAL